MKGINIWSGCSIGIGAALTNPTELAFRKGNLKNHYPVEFKGRVFRDAEAAYQNHKFGHLQQDMTLTLSGLKTLRFLRDCAINIPIARVPKLSAFARKCVLISFGRLGVQHQVSRSPHVLFSKLDL